MARNEQVRIDLVAKDDASKTIDKVADKVENLEDDKVEIPVTADTDQAERAIKDVRDDAQALSRTDADIVLRAKVDAAKADLKALQDELKQTGERAEDTARKLDDVDGGGGGISTRGNAIADLTGPLGEASSAASDFAGVFDGIGDIAEDVTSKLGLSAGMASKVSGAIAGLGIAVAAGAAIWSYFGERQKKAEEQARKLTDTQRKLNDAIREGNEEAAAASFEELYRDAIIAGRDLGLTTAQVVDHIRGLSTDALPKAVAAYEEMARAAALAEGRGPMVAGDSPSFLRLKKLQQILAESQADWKANNLSIQEQNELHDALADALGVTEAKLGLAAVGVGELTTAAEELSRQMQKLRANLDQKRAIEDFQAQFAWAMETSKRDAIDTTDEIRHMQDEYLKAAEAIGLNPIQVESDLKKIEQGDIASVYWTTQEAINRMGPLEFSAQIKALSLQAITAAVAGAVAGGRSAAPAAVTNVTMYLPRGQRERDVVAAGERAARRSGGLYRRTRR